MTPPVWDGDWSKVQGLPRLRVVTEILLDQPPTGPSVPSLLQQIQEKDAQLQQAKALQREVEQLRDVVKDRNARIAELEERLRAATGGATIAETLAEIWQPDKYAASTLRASATCIRRAVKTLGLTMSDPVRDLVQRVTEAPDACFARISAGKDCSVETLCLALPYGNADGSSGMEENYRGILAGKDRCAGHDTYRANDGDICSQQGATHMGHLVEGGEHNDHVLCVALRTKLVAQLRTVVTDAHTVLGAMHLEARRWRIERH